MNKSLLNLLIALTLIILYASDPVYSETLAQVRQEPLRAFVLTDEDGNVVDNGGVRIGLADMEFENRQSLQKYGIPEEIIRKLEPFHGLRGDSAIAALKQRQLKLTQAEYDTLNQRIRQNWMQRLQGLAQNVQNDSGV